MSKVNEITGRTTTSGRIRGTTGPLDDGARALRQRMTPAETRLWEFLRRHRLRGLPFRRQHPVGPFIVDFACPSRMLAVELDGSIHDSMKEQDAERERILAAYGWRILRFENNKVFSDLETVLATIAGVAESLPIVFRRQTAECREQT